jgi:hypothetical protein
MVHSLCPVRIAWPVGRGCEPGRPGSPPGAAVRLRRGLQPWPAPTLRHARPTESLVSPPAASPAPLDWQRPRAPRQSPPQTLPWVPAVRPVAPGIDPSVPAACDRYRLVADQPAAVVAPRRLNAATGARLAGPDAASREPQPCRHGLRSAGGNPPARARTPLQWRGAWWPGPASAGLAQPWPRHPMQEVL